MKERACSALTFALILRLGPLSEAAPSPPAVVAPITNPTNAEAGPQQSSARAGNNVLKFQTPDKRFEGYAEPLPLQPNYMSRSPQNPLMSRIYILPKLSAVDCLVLDSDGNRVDDIKSAQGDLTAQVFFQIDPNMPDAAGKRAILSYLYNLQESRAMPTPPDTFVISYLQGRPIPMLKKANKPWAPQEQEWFGEFSKWLHLEDAYQYLLGNFQFQSVAPKGLLIQVSCLDKLIGQYPKTPAPAATYQTSSTFSITSWEKGKPTVQNLKNGNFTVDVSYSVPLSRVQTGFAVRDLTAFSNYAVDTFKSAVQQASSSGGSFLFFDFSDSSISEFLRAEIQASGGIFAGSNTIISGRDVSDPALMGQLQAIFFPPLSQEQFRSNHEKAAAALRTQAAGTGKAQADLHDKYVKAVLDKKWGDQVDVLKAVTSLADDDIAGFISSGLSFGTSSADSEQQYRSVGRASYSSVDVTSVSGMLANLVEEKYRFTFAGRPGLISSSSPAGGSTPH